MVEIRNLRDMDAEDKRARIEGQPVFTAGIPFSEEVAMAITAGIDGLRQVLAPHLSDRVLLNFLGDPDVGKSAPALPSRQRPGPASKPSSANTIRRTASASTTTSPPPRSSNGSGAIQDTANALAPDREPARHF